MKKLLNFLFGRLFIIGVLIFLQALFLVLIIWKLSNYSVIIYAINVILSMGIMIWLVSKDDNPSVKLPWVLVIAVLPIFGGLFYIMFGSVNVSFRIKRKFNNLVEATAKYYPSNQHTMSELTTKDKHVAGQCKYIQNLSHSPVYANTYTEYFSMGEDIWEKMKSELQQAKNFIFMEYFIVHEGKMWNELLEILVDKAKQGVEVRFMYDDVGCVNTLPIKYNKKLESLGIKTTVFNPFRPSLSVSLHNRDHRKITVIDGVTGFTGGVNLADEYINHIVKHGHWKDTGVMLKGDGVWNLTMMFLQSWNYYNPTDKDYSKYQITSPPLANAAGYVQAYGDYPFDNELVSENVYLNMINNCYNYLYINTPYLIVDNELLTALGLAAKRGVDVRICTPHVPDKWYVHLISQANYQPLIKAGVKIYEYTPGFIHAKSFVSDDNQAIVGTINLDYRSLYHHLECGVFMYEADAVLQCRDDFIATLKKCQEITLADCYKVRWYKRFIRGLIRIFAPLM